MSDKATLSPTKIMRCMKNAMNNFAVAERKEVWKTFGEGLAANGDTKSKGDAHQHLMRNCIVYVFRSIC